SGMTGLKADAARRRNRNEKLYKAGARSSVTLAAQNADRRAAVSEIELALSTLSRRPNFSKADVRRNGFPGHSSERGETRDPVLGDLSLYQLSLHPERLWNRESQDLCRLQIDHQLERRGLFDRKIGGLRALEDLVDVSRSASVQVDEAWRVRQ